MDLTKYKVFLNPEEDPSYYPEVLIPEIVQRNIGEEAQVEIKCSDILKSSIVIYLINEGFDYNLTSIKTINGGPVLQYVLQPGVSTAYLDDLYKIFKNLEDSGESRSTVIQSQSLSAAEQPEIIQTAVELIQNPELTAQVLVEQPEKVQEIIEQVQSGEISQALEQVRKNVVSVLVQTGAIKKKESYYILNPTTSKWKKNKCSTKLSKNGKTLRYLNNKRTNTKEFNKLCGTNCSTGVNPKTGKQWFRIGNRFVNEMEFNKLCQKKKI